MKKLISILAAVTLCASLLVSTASATVTNAKPIPGQSWTDGKYVAYPADSVPNSDIPNICSIKVDITPVTMYSGEAGTVRGDVLFQDNWADTYKMLFGPDGWEYDGYPQYDISGMNEQTIVISRPDNSPIFPIGTSGTMMVISADEASEFSVDAIRYYDKNDEELKIEEVIVYKSGDVNMDKKVDISDAIQLNSFILGKSDLDDEQMELADLNKDNKISVIDVALLKRKIINSSSSVDADKRIVVSGDKFMVDGKEIWFNGANTPWDNWNDFGGNFEEEFWDSHFEDLHNIGVNSTRIWITCNGDVGIDIDANGKVIGATDKHWQDVDKLMEIAEKHEIYVMATMISFDHFKNNNKDRWRAMVKSDENIDAFVDNYIVPFAERYDDNDYLFSIDLCNEPDWIKEKDECGRIPWETLDNYFAKAAAGIHKNSDVLVTVGMGVIKYNADGSSFEGNVISDSNLKSQYNDELAFVDFNSTHYYEWQRQWYGTPFDRTPAEFGLDTDKPALIGELPGNGLSDMTPSECYEGAYNNGWKGAMAWTSNGVDEFGTFETLSESSKHMMSIAEDMIFPQ